MRIILLVCRSILIAGLTPLSVNAQEVTSYQYDSLGRLVGSSISGGPNNGLSTKTCFDPSGNRRKYFIGPAGTAPTCASTFASMSTPASNERRAVKAR